MILRSIIVTCAWKKEIQSIKSTLARNAPILPTLRLQEKKFVIDLFPKLVSLQDETPEEILSYLVPRNRQMMLDSDLGKAPSELDKKGEENATESSVPDNQLHEKITGI
ncbi:hypothetical protein SLEP1_g5592 [Rubroshorea leprosula]|uniref:Uncharacterized protein n=1 Tax=Rubroshorea leprosula TaxID=152421 RepID=A0AAV5HYA9_9ROSI|nr:hypothetical protein SLEP1_g5592 [Rubroshorea leprosula]